MTTKKDECITVEVDKEKGIEKYTAPDKTEYSHNLNPKGSYCWIYQIRKGRFKTRIIQKRTLRAVPANKSDSGYFQEQEFQTLIFQLEQGIKKPNGEWDNIKMTMSPMDSRNLQAVFDSLDTVNRVFSDKNKRVIQ